MARPKGNEMKTQSLYEQYKEEFMKSDREYCFYCCTPKDDKHSCCHENHFGTFIDFDEQDQQEIINNELDERT
jgi:hypothetical protein